MIIITIMGNENDNLNNNGNDNLNDNGFQKN